MRETSVLSDTYDSCITVKRTGNNNTIIKQNLISTPYKYCRSIVNHTRLNIHTISILLYNEIVKVPYLEMLENIKSAKTNLVIFNTDYNNLQILITVDIQANTIKLTLNNGLVTVGKELLKNITESVTNLI